MVKESPEELIKMEPSGPHLLEFPLVGLGWRFRSYISARSYMMQRQTEGSCLKILLAYTKMKLYFPGTSQIATSPEPTVKNE